MKKLALTAFASIAVLGLAACSKSDDPNAQASADNAEMPAEEAVNSAEPGAQPVPDSEASAAAEAKAAEATKKAAVQTAKDFEDLGGEAKPADTAK